MEQKIAADIKSCYGLTCADMTPVTGGWMNQKWRAKTESGDVLIKQFSLERYNGKSLRDIESALQRQIHAKSRGVPCPSIRTYRDQAIRTMPDGTAYMLMDFCSGHIESPTTVTTDQMHSLGDACGRMHAAFAMLPPDSVKGYPFSSDGVLSSLWTNHNERVQECAQSGNERYHQALSSVEPILRTIDRDFLNTLPRGIAHEDFTPDNMLFTPDGVSAIIDFDRGQYGFIWHDIGRAVLSLALTSDRLNTANVRAFVDGYSQHRPLTLANVADALRAAWCVEIPWWFRLEFIEVDVKEKIARFLHEMHWVTTHWHEIDEIAMQ